MFASAVPPLILRAPPSPPDARIFDAGAEAFGSGGDAEELEQELNAGLVPSPRHQYPGRNP
jgi:hypothetical protein